MSCRDKSLYVPKGVGCGDCEITYDGVLEALGYSVSESTQTLPDGQGELDRLIIGKPLDRYPTSLTITSPPDKTVYKPGEFFDPTGMVVTIGYSDGSTGVAEHYEVTVDTPLTDLGSNTYTVTVSELGLTVTASSIVIVSPADTVERTLNGVVTLIISEDPASEASHESAYGPITRNHGAIEGIDAINIARVAGGQNPIFPWSSNINDVISDMECEIQIIQSMFRGYEDLAHVGLENVILTGDNASYMFSGCYALEYANFRIDQDTSAHEEEKIKNASYMFRDCRAMTNILFKGTSVVNASYMLEGCMSLRTADLELPNCKSVSGIFDGCTSLFGASMLGLGDEYDTYSVAYDLDIRDTVMDGYGLRALIDSLGSVRMSVSPRPTLYWTNAMMNDYITVSGDVYLDQLSIKHWDNVT